MSSLVSMKTGWDVVTAGAVVGCGVMGGVFFAFSTFVMSGLGRLPARQGVAAMQSINITAVRPAFMLGLFGTAIVCAVSVVRALTGRVDRHGSLVLAGALIYLVGAIGLTIVYNVPLNNRLAALSPDAAGSTSFWHEYLRNWTLANHVRTASCVAATVLLLWSLSSRPSVPLTAAGVGTVRTTPTRNSDDSAHHQTAAAYRGWTAPAPASTRAPDGVAEVRARGRAGQR